MSRPRPGSDGATGRGGAADVPAGAATVRARIGRWSERLVLTLAAALGTRSGDALIRMADGAVARAPGRRVSSRRAPRFALARTRDVWAGGDLVAARARIDTLFAAHPESTRVIELRHHVVREQGDLTEQARMLHRMHLLEATKEGLGPERAVVGELVVTAPGWLPRIQGPPRSISPGADEVVLYLARVGSSGWTGGLVERARVAAQAGGLRPVLVSLPALRASADARDVAAASGAVTSIDEMIERHLVDLGPFYPPDAPIDRRLEAEAWLASGIARRVAPMLIHALPDDGDPSVLLIALALRTHLGLPLVCDAVPSVWQATAGDMPNLAGERLERVVDTGIRSLQAADLVVTSSEGTRAGLVARGVAAGRISVVTEDAAGPGLNAVHRDVLDRFRATTPGVA